MTPDVELFLYSGKDCHLCEVFITGLEKLLGPSAYTCHIINIDSDPELKQRYGARIPVLVGGGVELCEQVLDENRVRDYLANTGLAIGPDKHLFLK